MSGILQMFVASGAAILAPHVTVITTAVAGSITTPSGYSKVTVEALGGGGSGNIGNTVRGGGGGLYAISNANIAVTGGTTIVYYSVGGTGVQSWVNVGTNAAPTVATTGCLAKNGGTNQVILNGQTAGSIGATTIFGGNGSSTLGGGGSGATTAGSGQTAGTDTTGLSPSTLMGGGTGGIQAVTGTVPSGGGGKGGTGTGAIGRVRIVFYQ